MVFDLCENKREEIGQVRYTQMWKRVTISTILGRISKFDNYREADTRDKSRDDMEIANLDISL
jgi:hypothetical protein